VPITLSGPNGQRVVVQVPIDNRQPQASLPGKGHVEGNGYVSISGPHYSRAVQAGATSWQVLESYGRTSTGITLVPGTAPRQAATASAPHLEYQVQLHRAGPVKLRAYLTPTIDFNNAGGLMYAVALDDEVPQLVNISEHRPDEAWVNDNSEKAMMDNIRTGESAHQLAAPGVHTLKFWVITPGIVLQKLVLDTGGLKDSYLGPPESFRRE
jgi:hypothetical protein